LKNKNDTRYWLTTFFEEAAKVTFEYKHFQEQIENNGFFIVKSNTDNAKIYHPGLAAILTSKKLEARNMDTEKETIVNGLDYLATFIESYKKGEKYFENEVKVSPSTRYGINAEQYVKDIHQNFFHVKHSKSIEGWSYVKKQHPFILTHKAIKEYGYYSGIVSKVEEEVKKHPRLFKKFDKCDHDTPPHQVEERESQTKNVISESFENMDKRGWEYAFVSLTDYDLFLDLLTRFFAYNPYTLPKITIQLKRTCKTKVAKALGEIHKELSEKPLNSDKEYLNIVRLLNHFKDVSDFELVKSMHR
jgi:hypothetical protein